MKIESKMQNKPKHKIAALFHSQLISSLLLPLPAQLVLALGMFKPMSSETVLGNESTNHF